MTTSIAAVAALLAAAGPAAGDDASPRRLTSAEVVQLALSESPDLVISEKGIEAAKAHADSTRALRWPRVTLDANAFFWGKEISFDLPLPCPPDMTDPENPLCPVKTTVREQLTASATVSVVQPLSPLVAINAAVDAEESGIGAAEAEHRTAKLEVAFLAADGYLRLLQARAGKKIADTAVGQLTAHVDRAKILQQGGVIERVDVMRIEAALAAARQQSLAATRMVDLAEKGLVLVLGLPPGTSIDAVDDMSESPGAPSLDAAGLKAAGETRPELAVARKRAEQADSLAYIEWLKLVPRVYAVGTYQHNEGSEAFQGNDEVFVGLTLEWDAWDWGHQRNLHRSAKIGAVRAKLAAERQRDRIRFEVESAAAQAKSTFDAIEVAQAGLTVAEEAFRIQRERFNEGALSTTELLDAETEVMRARLGHVNARYEHFAALVALARATGQLPDALLPRSGGGR